MTVEMWRHKPVVKQVMEYRRESVGDILEWAQGKVYEEAGRLVVRTPQGDLEPAVGDWIVQGIEGEFYPVPRSIFLGSYEFVGGA